LVHLQELPALESLFLDHTQLTDAALAHLLKMPALRVLLLDGTDVTDEGLAHLSTLKGLRRLDLRQTKVTLAGVQRLREALPNTAVDADFDPADSRPGSTSGTSSPATGP
jgi:hypothetical protein